MLTNNNKASSIKIYARVKPSTEAVNYYDISKKEAKYEALVIHTTSKEKKDANSATHSFKFQKVFTECAVQADIFDVVASPVVQAVFSGYNGAILAYGQTGTGKTHSISGGTTDSTRGMIPRAFQKIFDMIAVDQANNSPREFAVAMSTLEIYNELCIDLLRKDSTGPEEKFRVELREDAAGNVRLRNLKEYPVRNMQDVEKYLAQSMANRVTADTPMNQHSSRSHCIFTLYLRQRVNGERKQVKSKLHLIDLSGSERVWKNRISGHLLYEAKHINLSLHYLEQVIIALNDPKRSHVPYRNSSITNFLRDSLGGNSRTAMVFTISLEPNNFFETLSTCRFSQRVSLVKNHTKKVIEYDKDEELDFLRLEVERLKRIISEMIGEDQMKLRISASEESMPSKDAHRWIKKCSSEPQAGGKFSENLNCGSIERKAVDVEKKKDDCEVRPNESNESILPDSKATEAQDSSSTEYSTDGEYDGDTKRSKKSSNSSTSSSYLDEVYNLLTNDDSSKADLLNIKKLLTDIGLELPYADRNSGRRFNENDQEDFKRYLELQQNREVLKVYVRLSIMFQRHVQNENSLIEKAFLKHKVLEEVRLQIESNIDYEKSLIDLENAKAKEENKYQKYFKLILKSKKKRFYYIKLFNQTKLLLADAFMDWRTECSVEDESQAIAINVERARLRNWTQSLRASNRHHTQSLNTIQSECTLPENNTSYDTNCNEERGTNLALREEVQRLNNWTWNLRNRPRKIPEPNLTALKSPFSPEEILLCEKTFQSIAGGDTNFSAVTKMNTSKGSRQIEIGVGDS